MSSMRHSEILYRQTLSLAPQDTTTVHLLALTAYRSGRPEVAADLIRKAISINPTAASYHSNLGNILRELNAFIDSVAACRKALCLLPDFVEAYSNLGNALRELGHHKGAASVYGAALRIKPDYAEAHSNLGVVLRDLGHLTEAVIAGRSAVCLKPEMAGSHSNLGNALKDISRLDEAARCYDVALRVQPNFPDGHANLGGILLTQDRLDPAAACFRLALVCKPNDAETQINLAIALQRLARLNEAVAVCRQALRIRPDFAGALSNLGRLLRDQGLLDDAVGCQTAALCSKPDDAASYYSLGNVLLERGNVADAALRYARALTCAPTHAEAHYVASFPQFLLGDLTAGWALYEWRWRGGNKRLISRDFQQPQWSGGDIAGKTLLLHAEQGLGDSLQFCRYAALVSGLGARVILEAPKSLLRLLASLDGVDRLLAKGDPLPDFDLHCPLMSLPLAFGTCIETIPANVPYLAAEPESVVFWRATLPLAPVRVGIAWQGSPGYDADRNRSFPVSALAPLAKIPGVKLISLQKIHGLDQLEDLPDGMTVERLPDEFDAGPDAFVDTAAVMMTLDLIITADTAIGHLAGALGRPVWLPLASPPHWVWMLGREDTPWYPNTRLFRQTKRGVWQDVFDRMAVELTSMVSGFQPA